MSAPLAHDRDAAAFGTRHLGRMLLLLTLAALAVRLAFLVLEPPTAPVADETVWVHWGTSVLPSREVFFSPLRYRLIFHPPLYPYFMAVPFALFGTLTAVKVAQAVAGALLVPALGRVGARAFGPRVGVIAAAIAAFYPELVWFSVHFWAETVFVAVLWWAFERLLAADAGTARTAAAAGLVWGLAVLTRETVLYFAPLAALWLWWRRPGGGARAASFLLAVLVTVAPWTYRNWVAYGAFVPVSTAGALNLYQGNAPLSRQEVYEEYWAVKGRIEKYRFARRAGLEAIWDRQPAWLFEKLRDEMPNFWEADSQPLVHIKRGAYGTVRPAAAVAAALVVLLPYLAALALFVLGLAALPLERSPVLLVAFLAYYNLIHVVTHGYARYRLPALPVVFLLAGYAGAGLRVRALPALSATRKAVGLAAAVTLVLSLVPSFRLQLDEPAFGRVERPEPFEERTPVP